LKYLNHICCCCCCLCGDLYLKCRNINVENYMVESHKIFYVDKKNEAKPFFWFDLNLSSLAEVKNMILFIVVTFVLLAKDVDIDTKELKMLVLLVFCCSRGLGWCWCCFCSGGGLGSHRNWLHGMESPLIKDEGGQKEIKLRWQTKPTYNQFHPHFMCAFFVQKFGQSQTLTLSRETAQFKKNARV